MKLFRKINWLILFLLDAGTVCAQPTTREHQLLYVGAKDDSAYLGVLQGIEEANLQGEFLGLRYALRHANAQDFKSDLAVDALAILVAADTATVRSIAGALPQTPVFNLTNHADELRADCLPNALHVIPSNSMLVDALAQWRKKEPESKAIAQAWHRDFVKYAARDLNKRYRETHGVPMDDAAWAGWAAVKIVTDTLARQPITQPAELLAYVRNELVFDGQKGTEMNFRPNGQLRQILLLVENDEIVGEAPVAGVVKPAELDTLGQVECGK
jgi:ABC-type branched-subunit amino acid transport system substrate-binding protein